MKFLGLYFGVVIACFSNTVYADDFHCLEGAKDSGPYYPGKMVRWCEIQKDDRLLYHGSVWRWYPRGQMAGKEFYVMGAAQGETQSWYENGNREALGVFDHGAKTGLWKYWGKTGKISTEVTYAPSGNLQTEYYPSGTKKAEGSWVTSGKIGKWTYWDEKGKKKARCDFGNGLFSLRNASCKLIADEIEPKGFSFPIPIVSTSTDADVSLKIATQEFHFTVPTSWIADTQSGKKEQTPLVLYPKGGAWREKLPNIYINVLYKNGADFNKVTKNESETFQDNVSDYTEKAIIRHKLKDGRAILSKSISYKPVIQTDSPFSIVAQNTFFETANYVDASSKVVLVIALACEDTSQLEKYMPVLTSFINSMH